VLKTKEADKRRKGHVQKKGNVKFKSTEQKNDARQQLSIFRLNILAFIINTSEPKFQPIVTCLIKDKHKMFATYNNDLIYNITTWL